MNKFWVLGALLLSCGVSAYGQTGATPSQPPEKVLRYAFRSAETGFDPAQISDLYSRDVTRHIFDGLYRYDYLARPLKVRPALAADMPQVSADFKTYIVKLKPGIFFADDPAFKGQKKELTAADVVYSFKRIYDPITKSPSYPGLEQSELVGMKALRVAAEKPGAHFDYDKEVDGIKALDRYTVQFKLGAGDPRFVSTIADGSVLGIVAREVVEFYGDKIMEHPVGTGPFKLDKWTRSSFISLVRSPDYREVLYDEQPAPDDAVGQALLARFKGRRLPMIDRVNISIIEEQQPRWLSFLGGEHDFLERLPEQYVNQAIPGNKLAPNLVKQGVQLEQNPAPDIMLMVFNMNDPTIGGYAPDKVALRRAMVLALSTEEEIRVARRGQAILAQGPVQPGRFGYDPTLKSEMSEYSPAKAKALLDMFGYVDKHGTGWRDRPDGSPLLLEFHIPPDAIYRELSEIWKKNWNAVGLHVEFKIGQWADQLKMARSGKLMIWALGFSASTPDGGDALSFGYGLQKGEDNLSSFQNTEFDKIYDRQKTLPDGPERFALIQKGVKILLAYAPYKFQVHRILTDLSYPWVIGYKRNPITQDFWRYIDIDASKQPH